MANKSKAFLFSPFLTGRPIQVRFVWNGTRYVPYIGDENTKLPHSADQINSTDPGVTPLTLTESGISLSDVTTLDVSTTKHGLTPKLPNDATKFLNGVGAFSVPAGGGGSSWALGSVPPITSPVAVQVQQGNLSTVGHNDVYTCPANKKAWIRNMALRNNSGAATVIAFPEIKISGTYYRAAANVSTTNGNQNTLGGTTFGNYILNAGESLSINVDGAGLNLFGWVIEFPDTNLFYTSRINNLANGDNTLYTTPVGKTAYILNDAITESWRRGIVSIVNAIGGAGPTWNVYTVPSGGSTGATNLGTTTTGAADKSYTRNDQGTVLNAGDFIVINTSVGTAGQIAWVSVYEF